MKSFQYDNLLIYCQTLKSLTLYIDFVMNHSLFSLDQATFILRILIQSKLSLAKLLSKDLK